MSLSGCGESDPIREYAVPRAAEPGALWFFKVLGPEDAVSASADTLRGFVESVRFDGRTGLPTWNLPEGWSEEPGGNSVRYRTIKLPGDTPLEVAVTQISARVPLSADDLKLQTKMLREQVGKPEEVSASNAPSTDAAAAADVSPITVDSHAGNVFDFAGETARFGKTRLFAAMIAVPTVPAAIPQPGGGEFPLTYTAPAEWKEAPQTQFSIVSMSAGEGDSVATMTITPAMGGPLANVNRWRSQTGLSAVEEADLVNVLDPIESNDLTILYTEAIGETRGILGAMVPLESGEIYFIKLDGPPARVKDEQASFRKFLESLRPVK